jgi:transposase
MSGPSATPIQLAPEQLAEFRRLASSPSTPQALAQRARILIYASEGRSNAQIARLLGITDKTVRKWRDRYESGAPKELKDAPRSGRPSRVAAADRAVVRALACVPVPEDYCRTRWSQASLQDALRTLHGIQLSKSEIGRILRLADIRPHQFTMWLHSPDADIHTKSARVCSTYELTKNGVTVLSIDEKTGIQALSRRFQTRRCASGRKIRMEFEYKRHGTTTLIACMNVATGEIHHRLGPTRTADDTMAFMEYIATRYPSGPVYIVWDNLNTHHDGPSGRWSEFNARHGGRFHFVYTPIHASWLNQVECWFSVLERRILRGASWQSVASLNAGIDRFIARWNQSEKHPFKWTCRGMTNPDNSRYAA